MALTFKFYHDAALTQPITGAAPIEIAQASDGSTGAVTKTIYFGSASASKKLNAQGGGAITVSVTDSAQGSGQPASAVKLAATLVGLDGAVGGASLSLSSQINSGVGNAVPIYIRVLDGSGGVVATSTELGLATNTVVESAA